jgi:hypothetical protein
MLAVSGCDRPPSVEPAGEPSALEFAQGAVQVRQLESTESNELLFEIDVLSTGTLTLATGPSGMSMAMPIRSAPDRRVLRIVREELEGETILNRFVRPLFGEDAAQQLQDRDPEAAERKLLLTTLILTGDGEIATMGPLATALPRQSSSTSRTYRSGSIDEPRARLAAWLYLPYVPGVRERGVGIAPDGPRITLDGEAVTVEEAGAIFTELTLAFTTEPLSVASN